MTTKDIAPGDELFVYYGDNYAGEHLGINVDNYLNAEAWTKYKGNYTYIY